MPASNTQSELDIGLKNLVAVIKRALPLKELPRIGWILEGARRDDADSVAAHSYIVVLISLLVTKQLKDTYGQINTERVLSMATLHDLGECVTGDLDSGLKRRVASKTESKTLLEEIEQQACADLLKDFQGSAEWTSLVTEYDQCQSKEAKIVKFADVLEAFAHAHDRLGKRFEIYLEHSKDKLRQGSPGQDNGVGIQLATWLSAIETHWSSIEPKTL